jgi:superfamily II DNA or RNA helicase
MNQTYICNSRRNRLELLAGIVDKNGYIDENTWRIQLSPNANGAKTTILYLVRSLGFSVKCIQYANSFIYIHLHSTKYVYIDEIPLRRKINTYKTATISTLEYNFHLRLLDKNQYYGFQIDGNRRFVLGDFTVTHNTTISLNIISRLKKKTLVIVHKEFLLNQWVERILQFLPTARVGRIQGQVIDIEDKDIVIGMLQSLSMKEYPETMFESFGLTIIDEVHHISSEVFSRALFKIVTQYMLGLSATMERKDGTTYVFKMFLGDVVYKGSRDEEHDVCVRAIQYVVDDAEFNETEVDFRGNPKFSTMITKLCAYNRRSDFIVRVLKDLLQEQPTKQIMVLSHNRSLLTYIYEAVTHFKIATIGYYVGGMKQTALQDTETKLIVLATYAMAAEALDIKTLSSLVMVTPKTDIVQSVGRILRVKHEKPIVVDIVDSHDIFQNQWAQRRRYYKRCNYRIRHIDSKTYTNMMIDWETDMTWKRVFEPKKNTKTGCSALPESCESGITEEDDDIDETPRKQLGKCLINIEGMEEL